MAYYREESHAPCAEEAPTMEQRLRLVECQVESLTRLVDNLLNRLRRVDGEEVKSTY